MILVEHHLFLQQVLTLFTRLERSKEVGFFDCGYHRYTNPPCDSIIHEMLSHRAHEVMDFSFHREETILRETVAYESYMNLPISTQDIMKHRGNPLKLKKGHLRKKRVEWTAELHSKFVKACNQLGPECKTLIIFCSFSCIKVLIVFVCFAHLRWCIRREDAVPKRILEVMGVPGLTREQVASHLQKYRNSVRSFGADQLSVSSSNKMEKLEGERTSHTLEGIYTSLGTRLPFPGSETSTFQHLLSDEGFSSAFPPKLGFYGGLSTSQFHGQSEQEMEYNLCLLPPPVKEIDFPGDGCKHHGNFAGYVLTGNQISVQLVKFEDSSSSNSCKEAQKHYIPAVSKSLSISEYSLFESLFHGDGNHTVLAGCSSAHEQLALPLSSSRNYCLQEKPGDDELQCFFDHIVEQGYSPSPENGDFDYLLGQQCNADVGNHINWDFDFDDDCLLHY